MFQETCLAFQSNEFISKKLETASSPSYLKNFFCRNWRTSSKQDSDVESSDKGTSTDSDDAGCDDAKSNFEEVAASHKMPESLFQDLSMIFLNNQFKFIFCTICL